MPVKIKSSGGGSVSLDVPITGTDYTLTMPATSGSIVTTADANTITSGMLAANSVSTAQLAANSVSTAQLAASSITAAKLSSGMIVKTTSYCSGYGSGARLTTTSTSWQGLNINGTGRDSYVPSENNNLRYFDKVRADSHLRIRTAIPIYITPGGTGVGLRVQMVLSNSSATYTNGDNYFTVGLLSTGQAHGWGAIGYGGDNVGIINAYYDTQYSTNSSSVLSYSGRLHYYIQVYNWSSSDTSYWIDYSDSYSKYATWTVEEYIP